MTLLLVSRSSGGFISERVAGFDWNKCWLWCGIRRLDAAVAEVGEQPTIGERKKEVRLVYLETIGSHGNFCRHIKR